MKKELFLIMLSAMNFTFSQTEGEDLIILKSGKEIIGKVIEQKPSQYIKLLQLPSKDTVTVSLLDIDRMIKRDEATGKTVGLAEKEESTSSEDMLSNMVIFNSRPYHFHVTGSASGGDYATAGMGIGLYRYITTNLQLGITANYFGGLRNFDASRGPAGSIPIGLDVDYTLQEVSSGRLGLQVGCQVGRNFVSSGGHVRNGSNAYFDSGLYIQPAIGFRFNFTKNMGGLLELAYKNVQSKSYFAETNLPVQKHSFSMIVLGGSLFF